ncbi:MAG: L-threonylcarbamoyladenylate synthase [Nitrospirae bacterium]|nr:L-threonylcarbamoyladenylate synthase [Nitrospirota bacterium]
MLLKLTRENLEEALYRSSAVLERGGIIAYPTETFYGLGVKYDIEPALRKLYFVKQRPKEKAMPLIIGSVERLSLLTDFMSDAARELIRRFWPGPLTIIFEARRGLSEYIVSGNRVAVRIPGESFALELARVSGFPITATSANISGMPPADSVQMVQDYFDGSLDLIIDAGKTAGVLPSTIVDATGGELKLLRRGAADIGLL